MSRFRGDGFEPAPALPLTNLALTAFKGDSARSVTGGHVLRESSGRVYPETFSGTRAGGNALNLMGTGEENPLLGAR